MKIALTLSLFFYLAGAYPATAAKKPSYSFGVKITGHGPPMILIPGLKGSADTYNDVVRHYKDRYTCYVITLAGFAGQPPSGAMIIFWSGSATRSSNILLINTYTAP